MKRTVVFALTVAVISLIGTSCKSHERCPAYGKAPVKQEMNKRV